MQLDSTIPTIRSAAIRASTTHMGATRRVWLLSSGGGSGGPVDPVGVRLFTVGPAGFLCAAQVPGAWTALDHGRRGPRAHMYSLSSAPQGMLKPSARGEQNAVNLAPLATGVRGVTATTRKATDARSRAIHPRRLGVGGRSWLVECARPATACGHDGRSTPQGGSFLPAAAMSHFV